MGQPGLPSLDQEEPVEQDCPVQPVWGNIVDGQRDDTILLIQQGLRNCGFGDFADRLAEESGIKEKEEHIAFKDAVLMGDWNAAVALVPALTSDSATHDKVVYELTQKRYLEEVTEGATTSAVRTLQQELATLNLYPEYTGQLGSLLFFAPEQTERATAQASQPSEGPTTMDWMRQTGWDQITNESVLESVIELIRNDAQDSSQILLHPHRFETLAARAQHVMGVMATGHNTDDSNISLLRPYNVGVEQLPVSLYKREMAHSDEIWLLSFSNKGDLLVSASKDKFAVVHSVSEDGELTTIASLGPHKDAVANVAWRHDDAYLMTCSECEARVWAVTEGRLEHRRTVKTHSREYISCCTWLNTPVSSFLTAGSDKQVVKCYWENAEQTKWTMKDRVTDLVTACNGKIIIAVVGDHYIEFMRLTDHVPVASIRGKGTGQSGEAHAITSLNLTPDNEYLVTNMKDHSCQLWRIGPLLRRILRSNSPSDMSSTYGLSGDDGGESLALQPIMDYRPANGVDGKFVLRSSIGGIHSSFLACGSEEGNINLWHLATGQFLVELQAHGSTVNCVAWNPKYPYMMASASDDKTIGIWLSPHFLGKSKFIPKDGRSKELTRAGFQAYLAHRGSLAHSVPTAVEAEKSCCRPVPILERR